MRLPVSAHYDHPWRVRDLAPDFEVDEVWDFPIEADESRGETFAAFCALEEAGANEPLPTLTEWLVRLREALGKMGLDDDKTYPIPGCTELSLRDRLTEEERARPLPVVPGRFPFKMVYQTDNERLVEFSNSTVHAALHLGWVPKGGAIHTPRMTVLVKARGAFGRFYMGLIYPFRVTIVYPSLLQASTRRFEKWRAHRAGTSRDGNVAIGGER